MHLSWLKEHLGFTITIIGAGIGTAIWKGNSVTATVIVVVLVLSAVSVIGSRRDPSSRRKEEAKSGQPGPFSFAYSWQMNELPNLTVLEKELCARGLEPALSAKSESKLTFHRGSQFHTRLLGGYFVAPRFLPLRVEVKVDREAGGWVLRVCAQDTMGIGIRDIALQKRYALSAAEVESFVEESLNAEKVPGADV